MELTWLKGILLAWIRGLTEIFPVSGGAHQAIAQEILGLQTYQQNGRLFEAFLRLGIFCAVLLFFRRELRVLMLELLRSLHLKPRPRRRGPDRLSARMLVLILAASLPMLLTIPFSAAVQSLYGNLLAVAAALVLTGLGLYICDHLPHGNKDGKNLSLGNALSLGLCQALSVIPGISRTGAVLSASWALGVDSAFALRFGFLMWVPTLAIDCLVQLIRGIRGVSAGLEAFSGKIFFLYLVCGVLAGVAAFTALRLLRFLDRKKALGNCAFYCWTAAMVAFILFLMS